MITFVTNIDNESERDILSEVSRNDLNIFDLKGDLLLTRPCPVLGWTHEVLVELADEIAPITRSGADAYLGTAWVGSTEV